MEVPTESTTSSPRGEFADALARLRIPPFYAEPRAEWSALRGNAGLIDGHCADLLRLNGGDRATFLQGMITNDILKTPVGAGVYAALLTIQGRIVSDMRVLQLADEIWLDLPPGAAPIVRAALEKYIIADDVEFAEDEAWRPLLSIEGPKAARVVVAVLGESFDDLAPLAHREGLFEGHVVRVVAAARSGAAGFVVFGAPEMRGDLWARCCAAGADPVGAEALNVLRIEAGIPWLGVDIDDSVLSGEAEIETAISFRKGCYLGQEVVERVAARGQVQRKRVGLRFGGSDVPARDSKLFAADKEVGRVTSAVFSFAAEAVIGMGYVRREAWEPGTALRCESVARAIDATVAPLRLT